jgi:hypothetical protein
MPGAHPQLPLIGMSAPAALGAVISAGSCGGLSQAGAVVEDSGGRGQAGGAVAGVMGVGDDLGRLSVPQVGKAEEAASRGRCCRECLFGGQAEFGQQGDLAGDAAQDVGSGITVTPRPTAAGSSDLSRSVNSRRMRRRSGGSSADSKKAADRVGSTHRPESPAPPDRLRSGRIRAPRS